MEFRQFRYFVQMVESRSLSAAADALHVAQPALSQQLAQLETELGVTLLTRSARGVQPTPAGDAFYRQAKSILRQIADIPAIVSTSDREAVGTVSLGLPASVASVVALNLLARTAERFPRVTLEISEFPSSYLAELLSTARLELALLLAEPLPRGVVGELLLIEEVPLIYPSGLLVASTSRISLDEMASLPLIVPGHPNDLRRQIDEAFRTAGLRPWYAAQIAGTALIARAIRQGAWCSPLPWSAVHDDLKAGAFEMRDIEDAPFQRTAWLSRSSNVPLSPIANSIRLDIIELVRELIESGRWSNASVPARPTSFVATDPTHLGPGCARSGRSLISAKRTSRRR